MRITLILILSSIISINSSCQKIEIGHRFTIELEQVSDLIIGFKITEIVPYNKILETSKAEGLFETELKSNQIHGVFAKGKFGGKVNTMLILLSGFPKELSYDLFIKIPQERMFNVTSTLNLTQGVKSIEYWPYNIDKIIFEKFSTFESDDEFETFVILEKIDSICIKNPDLSLDNGQKLFIKHLKTVIEKFDKPEDFELNYLLDYEKSINSEDVSLGHFWSLGTGIYPNKKKFKFGNPISYRRIECPYFDNKVNYFYSKIDELIKVVSFNWNEFNISNLPADNDIDRSQLSEAFRTKYDFVVKEVSKLLGKPKKNKVDKDGRRRTKWKSKKGVRAYLFNFSNYNEIRLYIYKE